jgi:outer membrane protein assembly factor BamB
MMGINTNTIIGCMLVLTTALLLTAPAAASDVPEDAWYQFHKDVQHIGYSPSPVPDTNKILWASPEIGAIGSSSLVTAEGMVFVNCIDEDDEGDSYLVALNATDGTIEWNTTVPRAAYGSWSSPCYHDGNVFTATRLETNCVNASTGQIVWTFTSTTGSGSCNGGPAVADGKVFVNDWDGEGYYCLNETNGSQLWRFAVEGYAQGTPAYDNGQVFLTSWDYGALKAGHVYCVDADTGTQVWSQDDIVQNCCGSATIHGDVVYVTAYNFYGDGEVLALDKTDGSIIWQTTVQRTDSTPTVAYGNVYIAGGCEGFSLRQTYCLNASTGEIVWSTPTSENIGDWTNSPTVADGVVFTGESGFEGEMDFGYKRIFALDAFTGDVLWTGPNGGSTAAICNGTVYTISQNGRVYAYAGGNPSMDLLPASMDLPELGFVEFPNVINTTISNTGTTYSGKFNVSLEADGTVVDTQTVAMLGAGCNKTVSFTWYTDTPGDYSLEVVVDSEDVITESDEGNNECSPQVLNVMEGEPDLVPVAIEPGTMYEKQPYAMTTTIENNGFATAGSFNVTVKEEDTVISTGTIPMLYPFDTTNYTFMWAPATAGTANLTVIVDTDNAVVEQSETNNNLTLSITILAETAIEVPAEGDWPQFQRNWQRNASTNSAGPTKWPYLTWETNQYGDVDVTPLIVGDTAYIYSYSGYVRAYNKTDGSLKWNEFASSGLQTSIPAYGDGNIFVATGEGDLMAFNADTGNKLWTAHVTDLNLECPVTYYDHRLYIGEGLSGGVTDKQYYCYDDLGNLLWSHTNNDTAGFIWSGASVTGDYVVYPTYEGVLVSLDRRNGALADTINLSDTANVSFARAEPGMFRASLSYADGYVYTTSEQGQEYGFVWKVGFDEATGTFQNDGWSTQNGFSTSSPVVCNGRVYAGQGEHGYTGNFTCLDDTDGSVIWSYYFDAGIKSSPAVSMQGDDVYIYFTSAVENGSLYCLKDNGTEANLAWEFNPPEDDAYILQGAAISDGRVYFGTDGGFLYCIEENDWNPWNDPDSADGNLITNKEIQEAVIKWKKQSPLSNGYILSNQDIQALVIKWKSQSPM